MSDTGTLYLERVLNDLAHGISPQANAVTAALAELRALQAQDAQRQTQPQAAARAPEQHWP